MNRLISPYLLIAVIINIECNAQDTRPQLQNIHDSVVTIISALSPEEELSIYNIGIKDIEALPDVLKEGARDSIKFHIDRPTFLYVGTLSNTPLYVKPGDRIIAKNDTIGGISFSNVKYPERSVELNLFFKLNNYLERNGNKKNLSKTETELNFLDSLKDVQNLSAEFVQDAKHYINYKNLKYSYSLELRSKVSSGNVQPFPQNDSCIYLLPYRSALYNYLMLLNRKDDSKEFGFNLLNEKITFPAIQKSAHCLCFLILR